MIFLYYYKTSDNERRDGECRASSREAVYSALRKQGIRPYKVEPKPGLLNWIAGLGKRWYAIVTLAIAVSALAAILLREERLSAVYTDKLDERTRRQIFGDQAIIDKGIRTGWRDVFEKEGDRFLASFAIPGVHAGVRTTNVDALQEVMNVRVEVKDTDPMEIRQIKAMVEGMKEELRAFVADGGTIQRYGDCLVRRQETEITYYNRAKREVERLAKSGASEDEVQELLEKRNEALRRMGVRLVVMPEN